MGSGLVTTDGVRSCFLLAAARPASSEVPRRARIVRSLASIAREVEDRNTAIRAAYATGGYTLRQIGEHFDLHESVVSRIARGVGALQVSSEARAGRARNKT